MMTNTFAACKKITRRRHIFWSARMAVRADLYFRLLVAGLPIRPYGRQSFVRQTKGRLPKTAVLRIARRNNVSPAQSGCAFSKHCSRR